MNKNCLKSFILLFVASILFVGCEDDIVKSDYDVDSDFGTSDVLSYQVNGVGANYAIIEGVRGSSEDFCGILVANNADLYDAKVFPIDEEGDFNVTVPALSPSTEYFYVSYQTDSLKTKAFGEKKSFTTDDGVVAFFLNSSISSEEEWENAPFSMIDKDGDGNNWELSGKSLVSYSWNGVPLTPENYLVFPGLEYNGTNGVFSFSIQAADSDWYAETVKLVASKEPITEENCRDAAIIFEHTLQDGAVFNADVNVPSEYQGGSVYFALVHTDVTDMYAVIFTGASFIYQ